MNGILVGTSSWTDKTLIRSGRFYPPAAKTPEARLRHYAEHFPLVEVDTTYYALPAPRNAELWVERTPPGFVFDVKAFRLFTGHPARPRVLPADLRRALARPELDNVYYHELPSEIAAELWRRFRVGIEPIERAGKLGAVLLQFAPWVLSNRDGMAQVTHAAQMLAGYRVAVELRNRSWFADKAKDRILAFEREHRLIHVVVDEPQGFSSSIPQVWAVTCPELGMLRLHGRNREMWTKKGLASSAERFNYSYSGAELEALAASAKELAPRVKRLHVLFNNCHEDKAQRNATDFARLLSDDALRG